MEPREYPSDDLIVRAAEPEDADAVFEISNCPGVRHGTLQMPFQTKAALRERWASTPDGMYRLVAEQAGHVIGMAGLWVEPHPRRRRVGQIGMMVRDDEQGRGVGTSLLEALLDLADNWLDLHRIELDVYTDNVPGIHLYESHGFVIEGTRSDFAFRDGSFVDAYAMGRIRKEYQAN